MCIPTTLASISADFSEWLDSEGFTCVQVDDPGRGGAAEIRGHLHERGYVVGHLEVWRMFVSGESHDDDCMC